MRTREKSVVSLQHPSTMALRMYLTVAARVCSLLLDFLLKRGLVQKETTRRKKKLWTIGKSQSYREKKRCNQIKRKERK